MDARWIDLGALAPGELHATYAGVAQAQPAGAAPVVLWGRSLSPHVALGQSQAAALELDLPACGRAGVAIVRRPLGGGAVLVDADQECFFLVAPRGLVASRPAEFITRCLGPMAAGFRALGLPVQLAGGTDVWCRGRKIAGSGAATLGPSMVFGTSFVRHFSPDLFTAVVRCPSAGFRAWLRDALAEGFAAWDAYGEPPSPAALQAALRQGLQEHLGWTCRDSALTGPEREAMVEVADELTAEPEPAGRRVRDGIKINAATYLMEAAYTEGWLRLLVREGRVARVAAGGQGVDAALQACVGRPLDPAALVPALAGRLAPAQARRWAQRLADLARASEEGR